MQKNGDHEGLVDIGRDIEGVEVSIFLRQDDDDTYKVSLRSGSYVNVSDVCMIYGGGGHPRAAGAKIKGNLDQVKEKIVKSVTDALRKGNANKI